MKIIPLTSQNTNTSLILEPLEDTLFILPQNIAELQVNLRLPNPGVRAFLLGIFQTTNDARLIIHQRHVAPNTESHVLLKTLVQTHGNFSYQGNLHIEAFATGTIASQEARGLLLGSDSRFKAVPALEILPKEVVCNHKASSAPLNKDSLYALQTRGISQEESKKMLETAFLKSAFDTVRTWGLSDNELRETKKSFPLLFQNT